MKKNWTLGEFVKRLEEAVFFVSIFLLSVRQHCSCSHSHLYDNLGCSAHPPTQAPVLASYHHQLIVGGEYHQNITRMSPVNSRSGISEEILQSLRILSCDIPLCLCLFFFKAELHTTTKNAFQNGKWKSAFQ